jgi:PGF-CTERM protein
MTPTLDKRLSMEVGGEVRGNFNIYYNGDSDSTDNAGPCTPSNTPNDCDWLNITIYKGQTKIFQHTENPWPADQWKNIQFSYFVEEGNETWDGRDANPIVEITMKIKGDYNDGGFFGFPSGTPGAFSIELGESGSLLMPIDPASWEDTFQEGGELGATPAEDTPGFTLVVASAAIAMAAFINQRRQETEE